MVISNILIEEVKEIGSKNISDEDKINQVKDLIKSKGWKKTTMNNSISGAKKIFEQNNYLKDEKNLMKIKFPEITKFLREQIDKKSPDDKQSLVIPVEDLNTILKFNVCENPNEALLYLLFNSGLRFNDIMNREFVVKNDMLYTKGLSKKRGEQDKLFAVYLIDNNISEFIKCVNKVRNELKDIKIHTINKRVLRIIKKINEKLTVHKLRSLYVFYQLEIKKMFPDLIRPARVQKLINHKRDTNSVHYDQSVKVLGLDEDIVKQNKVSSLSKMTVKELKQLARERNIRGRSKLRTKQSLIDALS